MGDMERRAARRIAEALGIAAPDAEPSFGARLIAVEIKLDILAARLGSLLDEVRDLERKRGRKGGAR